jgi:hypothetical protein
MKIAGLGWFEGSAGMDTLEKKPMQPNARMRVWFLSSLLVLGLGSPSQGGVQGGAGSCAGDEAGISLNCTAEDVRIAKINLLQVLDGCSALGDTATVQMVADVEVNAAGRYDLGFYIATDGGNAQTGTCFKEYLPAPTVSDPTDAELATGYGSYWDGGADGDQCGDGEQNDVAVDPIVRLFSDASNPSQPTDVTVLCRDDNNNGRLDFDYCSGWRNNTKFQCGDISQAGIVQTAAKCKCDLIDINVPVPNGAAPPTLAIQKSVMLAGGTCGVDDVDSLSVSVGDSVEYCYRIENTSETDAYRVVVVDDAATPGNPGDDFFVTLVGLTEIENNGDADDLAAGAIAAGQAGPFVLASEGDYTNIVVAAAVDPATGTPVQASDDAEDTVTVGASVTGVITNIVEVCGTAAIAGSICDTDDQTVDVVLQDPGLTLVKTVMPVGGQCGVDDVDSLNVQIGGAVLYCYTVTAAGTPSTHLGVVDVVLLDDWTTPGVPGDDEVIVLQGLEDIDGDGLADDLRAGGVAYGVSPVYAVGSPGTFVNIAEVTGENPSDPLAPLVDDDTAEVVAALQPADFALVKTPMLATGVCGVDDLEDGEILTVDTTDQVAFCYYVRCGGSPATHDSCFNLDLVDDRATPNDPADDEQILLGAPVTDLDAGGVSNDLAAGARAIGTSAPTAVQGVGVETNWAVLSGEDGSGNPLSSTDSADVNSGLCIEVAKSASPSSVEPPGADVVFTFVVNNVCAINTVNLTKLEDSVYGDLDGQGTCTVPQVLAPLTSYSCSITEFVGGAAGDTHSNVVFVEGTDSVSSTTVTSDDSVQVPIAAAMVGCLHCPSKVSFRRDGPDFFSAAGWVDLGASFDPSANVLQTELSNASGVVLLENLPAGSMHKSKAKYWYRDKPAKVSGGYFQVRMKPGKDGLWQFKIRIYGDLSTATVPDMTLRITFGSIVAQGSGTWSQRKDGWQLRRFPIP